MLLKKECVEAVGGLDESLRCLEDYDFALRIAKNIRRFFWMRYTLMPVTRFREYQAVTVDSISSQAVCCLQSIRQTILRPILLITE